MNQGDIILLPYPYSDLSSAKVRPALVISGPDYNAGENVILAAISSSPKAANSPFTFEINDAHQSFKNTGLRKTSFVKWTTIFTLSTSLIGRRLGRLDRTMLAEVATKIQAVFDVPKDSPTS